jgi:hypothetical protein
LEKKFGSKTVPKLSEQINKSSLLKHTYLMEEEESIIQNFINKILGIKQIMQSDLFKTFFRLEGFYEQIKSENYNEDAEYVQLDE